MRGQTAGIIVFAGITLLLLLVPPAQGAQITNAFSKILVDGIQVLTAKSYNDYLNFVGGTGITVSYSNPNTITITNTVGPSSDTNTAQIGDQGTHLSIFGSRFNATKNLLKTITCTGATCSSNATDILIAVSASGGNASSLNDLAYVSNVNQTKGNIFFANGSQWSGLKVGSNNQVLTADSTTAAGLKWSTITSALKVNNQTALNNRFVIGINNLTGSITTNTFSVQTTTCSAGTHVSALNNLTGIVTCSTDSGVNAFTKINNFGSGTAALVATNSSGTANIKTLVAGTGISFINGSSTVTITNSISQGKTETNSIEGGTARLLKSNSTNEDVLKSLTAARGITITNGTNTITIDAPLKVANQTALKNRFVIGINNATGLITTNTFSVQTKTCTAGQHLFSLDNSTGLFTCTSDSGGFTKLNNLDGGDAKIVATNTTLSNTQATFKSLTAGTNILLTNGSKTITITGTNTAQIVSAGGVSIFKSRDNATQNTLYGLAAVAGNTTLTTGATTITINTGYNVMTISGSNQTVYHSLNITAGNKLQSTPNSKWTSLNIGTTSSDPTRLRQGDLWISGSSLKYNDNTNTTRTVSTGTGSGFTVIASSPTVSAKILASNTSNTAVIKSITQGTGISIVNGSQSITIGNSGVLSVSGTTNNVTVSASTGNVGFNLGSNVVVTGGSSQTINKILYHNGFGANYTKTSSATSDMGTKGVVLVVDAGTGNRTVNLPTATSNTGQIFVIMRNDTSPARTNMVKIDPSGSEKIDGALNYNLTRNGQTLMIQSIGSANKDWTMIMESGKPDNLANAFVKGSIMNRWYSSMVAQGTTTTTSQRASVMTATPLVLGTRTTFDQIQIDVTTLKAASTCRAAIYNDNGNGYPMNLISGSDVGTISTAGAGRVGNTFTAPITLNSGLYWLAFQCSGGGQVLRAWTNTQIAPVLGYVSTSTASSITTGWNVTQTYAAMPSNFPASTVTTTTHSPAMVLLRATG